MPAGKLEIWGGQARALKSLPHTISVRSLRQWAKKPRTLTVEELRDCRRKLRYQFRIYYIARCTPHPTASDRRKRFKKIKAAAANFASHYRSVERREYLGKWIIDNLTHRDDDQNPKAAAIRWANKLLDNLEALDENTNKVLNRHVLNHNQCRTSARFPEEGRRRWAQLKALAAMKRQLKGLFSVAVNSDELTSGSSSACDQILKMHQLTREMLSHGVFVSFEPEEFELIAQGIRNAGFLEPLASDGDSAASSAMRDRFTTFRQSGALDVIDILAKLDILKLVPTAGFWTDPPLTKLVAGLEPIWDQVTGRLLGLSLISEDRNAKICLMAEWIRDLLVSPQWKAALPLDVKELDGDELVGKIIHIARTFKAKRKNAAHMTATPG
jgi:hypothetical protein